VALGLLCHLPKDALKIGARLLRADLAGHVNEPFRLLRIVGRRFGLARHSITLSWDDMTEQEIRLRCLELAIARQDPREALELAGIFADFVIAEAKRDRPVQSSNNEGMFVEPSQHSPAR